MKRKLDAHHFFRLQQQIKPKNDSASSCTTLTATNNGRKIYLHPHRGEMFLSCAPNDHKLHYVHPIEYTLHVCERDALLKKATQGARA